MDKKNPDTASPSSLADSKALADELRGLMRLIGKSGGTGVAPENSGSVLALTRIVRGLGADDWLELARRDGLSDWLALPLDEREFPLLSHMLATVEELASRTEHDPLTGLAQPGFFERRLTKEIERVNRDGAVLSLGLLQVDGLDDIRARFGESCTERVFMELARSIGRIKRPYDLAARLEDNLFAVIMPGSRPHNVGAFLEKLQDAFGAPFACSDEDGCAQLSVSFSAGHATCVGRLSGSPRDFQELASTALEQARARGAGTIQSTKLPDETFSPQATMVHSDEKKFLFSGM